MLDWTVYISFLGIAFLLFLNPAKAGLARWVALLTAVAGLVVAFVGTLTHKGGGEVITIRQLDWVPSLGIEYYLGADGISLVLVLLTGVAAVVGILFSWNIEHRAKEFFSFYLALIAGVYGVFLSFDLFLLFVFYELAIIPKYFLVAIWGSTNREYGAMKLALYSFVGSAMVLIGLIATYVVSGAETFNLLELAKVTFPPEFQCWAFPLVFIGFTILAGIWPFHTWAPTGHVAAPTAASMLLAGVVMKLGAYGGLRVAMTLFPDGLEQWKNVIALLAAIGIVYGAMVALVQKDFKFVIGYSSVSHMGFVLLGMMTLTKVGLSGAVLQMFSHGIIAGLLFGVVGRMIYDRTHTRELSALQGMNLGKALPFAAFTFVVGGLASMGLPGFSGFAAEVHVFIGAWSAFPTFAVLGGVGLVVGVTYTIRTIQQSFYSGQADTGEVRKFEPITFPERLGAVVLMGLSLLIGLYPRLLLDLIVPAFESPLMSTLVKGRGTMTSYRDISILLLPEIIVVLGALVVLLVDLKMMRDRPNAVRMRMGALLSCVTGVAAICWLTQTGDPKNALPEGMLVVSLLTQFLKQILLGLTIFTALISMRSNFTDHVGEFFVLLLLATVGMMFMVSSENLLMIFVALELLSLSLYILTAFNKRNIRSAEAALKYFLFGGMSAAFLLFGLSLVYGLTGAIDLNGIAAALNTTKGLDPLLVLALVMTLTGLGFKVAAVPFHLWAPDAYEGAPAPSAAFIASGSKVASFFVLAQLMMIGFDGAEGSGGWRAFAPGWISLIAILAVLSMVLGNLAAIVQKSVRRLLAYSAIAHAGYALMGVMANSDGGLASLMYYVTTYAVTTLGAFAVVSVVQDQEGNDRFSAFAGLSRRSPLVAFCMMIFILSLAGIPPLAGFFGKFYVFVEVAGHSKESGLLWLVIVAIAMSAVSLYYYLQVLKQIYVEAPAEGAESIDPGLGMKLTLAALAVLVVVLGCVPNLLVGKLLAVIAGS